MKTPQLDIQECGGGTGVSMSVVRRRRGSLGTHVCAADALQQQSGDLCLPVKLCLGNTELMLRLVGGGEEGKGERTEGRKERQKEISEAGKTGK